MSERKSYERLPLLPLKDPDVVVFPGGHCEIQIGRQTTIQAVTIAKENNNGKIIIAFQKSKDEEEPEAKDFHGICCEAEIKSIIPMGSERIHAIVQGTHRSWLRFVSKPGANNFYMGDIERVEIPDVELDDGLLDQIRTVRDMIMEHVPSITVDKDIPRDKEELSLYLDNVASQLPTRGRSRLALLRISPIKERTTAILKIVAQLAKADNVGVKTHQASPNGTDNEAAVSEIDRLQNLINSANLPEEAKKVVDSEFKRLQMIPQNNSEFQVVFNYCETIASLPWSKSSEDRIDIDEARKTLDADHFGLDKVKERILEFLAVKKLAPDKKGSILCFSGPSGCGKTSTGKSIAKAMNRKFIRMSLGGVNDEAEIRGHRRTYIAALPGKIIQMMRKVEVNNPVFMLDEVDKLCRNMRGDPASSLLEVLDPEQNYSFVDNYLSIPFDLSRVMFIATVNDLSAVPPALRDRMEVIDISGYTLFDKINIAQKHLIQRKKEDNGLKDYDIRVSKEALENVVEEYTSEAGVRSLERYCGTLMRKMAVKVAAEEEYPNVITADMIPQLLGPPKVFAERAADEPMVGLSAGLAWSSSGGSLLFVETCLTPGTGKIELTGNLGKVIQESAKAALTWIKAHAVSHGLDVDDINKKDVHIHFPAGATPKDGPSAGIAVASSMLSAFLEKPIRNDTAMTGEISLRGRILPIGGLREKVMAAHRAGIKQVIYPTKNEYDLDEVPEEIRNDMNLVPMSDLFDAVSLLLTPVDEESLEN